MLNPAVQDPGFLYTPKNILDNPTLSRGLTCLQTDDTSNVGNAKFMLPEEKLSKAINFKRYTVLQNLQKLTFNGTDFQIQIIQYVISQGNHVEKLSILDFYFSTANEFITHRAQDANIASVCRPDLSFVFSSCSRNTNPDATSIEKLNKVIQYAIVSELFLFSYVRLDPDTVSRSVLSDAIFALNPHMTPQVGFLILLSDRNGSFKLINYTSSKCTRVIRSVLADKLYSAVRAFDYAS